MVRTFLAGLAGGLVGAVLLSCIQPGRTRGAETQTMRSTRFELVDSSGNAKAVWEVDQHGGIAIRFFDKEGTTRLELASRRDATLQMLQFADANGRARMTLTDAPTLTMGDATREARILLGSHVNDAPSPSDEQSWGLVFPKLGSLSAWAAFGVATDPKTGTSRTYLSLVQPNGKQWHPPAR